MTLSLMKKLWLDDERPAPVGWVRVRTAPEAIAQLETRGFDEVSLDHDLGTCDGCRGRCEHVGDGYLVACWLEERVMTDVTFPVPKVYVHTQNAAARPRMLQAVRQIDRLRDRRLVGEEKQ